MLYAIKVTTRRLPYQTPHPTVMWYCGIVPDGMAYAKRARSYFPKASHAHAVARVLRASGVLGLVTVVRCRRA